MNPNQNQTANSTIPPRAPYNASVSESNNTFRYNSPRARLARLGKIFTNFFLKLLLILGLILTIFGGLYLLCLAHSSAGWLLLALAAIFAILLILSTFFFPSIPPKNSPYIDDILSTNVLRLLSKNPTSKELAEILVNTKSGNFLAARYGMIPQVLTQMLDDSVTIESIFQKSRQIKSEINLETITGGVLVVALVESCPNSELFLRRLKLEISDLYDGITWYAYLHGIIKTSKKRRHTGGIARDLSFGFIPTLQRFGINISAQRIYSKTQINRSSQREAVDKMIEIFSKNGRQNVALIGADGTGRSTVVNAFAEEIQDADNKSVPSNLKFRQVFKLDAASIISTASRPGDVERLVNLILNEAYAAKNIIIYLDNAHLFFEDGVGSVNISNLLTPIIEAGALRIILIFDEQRYLELSARNSALANSLNKLQILPADESETLKIMQDRIPSLEYQHKVTYTIWSMKEAFRLSQRYIHDLEMPGRALNLLESSASYANQGFVMGESVATAIEKTQGIKLGGTTSATSTDSRSNLLNMENLIHQRMIDQVFAVQAVSDALRRSAAGIRNENKPIGTFLFLGPTGVGKTELAKALSEVYFGGEGNLVRIDLNEYVTENDVSRLIAESSADPMSLTAQVMKNPFSVVLLDEIEKAHPSVLTTLLQLLDEGILRDTKNHEVSFRDTIVIATSNAGANKIREWVSTGKDLLALKEDLTNELIANNEFKPEFLNRFDEICLFKPLSMEDCFQLIDLIMNSVNKTLAPQKITVRLEDAAKTILVQRGYDPQLGARPMRRIVQQTVENSVAKMMLEGSVAPGSEVLITAEMLNF
ncbi:MAG: ATP-dependent Clp protease ATP-binding subunit [Candidatus Saccharibacteria bacterium]|nr:ATP-dependent Clp protease ATP-binding subunit [Candidatus Saccharibacteria bacterium]